MNRTFDPLSVSQSVCALGLCCVFTLWACPAPDTGDTGCLTDLSAQVDIPEGSLVLADSTLPGVEGWLIDPLPLQRGDHAVLRLWRDPVDCDLEGGWYPSMPRHTSQMDGTIKPGNFSAASGPLRIVLVHGADPGTDFDAARWAQLAEDVSPGYAQLLRPDRVGAFDAVARACLGAGQEDTVLLAFTGGGSSVEGGALILGHEAVSYAALASHARSACENAGLLVLVLDASYVPDLTGAWTNLSPPTVLWRGSDAQVRNAPRVSAHGGGLLSAALIDHLGEHLAKDCLSGASTSPWEWARAFEGQADLRERMMRLLWQGVGEPALRAQSPLPPTAGQRLAAELEGDIPTAMRLELGDAALTQGCAVDADCVDNREGCDLHQCFELQCDGGRCVGAVDIGAPCNDGSVCTADDTCSPGGFCRGEALDCEDNNPCTTDTCVHHAGCVHGPRVGAPCDDQALCTVDDHCSVEGVCTGAPVDCSDQNPCTDTWCDPVIGCVAIANHAPCDDQSACTQPDYCEDGVCRGAPVVCIDSDPCTADTCDLELGCLNPAMPEGSLCDDGNGCTQDDRCEANLCVGYAAGCDDGFDCTLDSCADGICSHLPGPGTCLTANGCIPVGEHPEDNPCVICESTNVLTPSPIAQGGPCPDDGISCTTDLCHDGLCVHSNVPGTCHRADGSCVSVGESIGPCLTCVDTGTGAPTAEGTPCDDGSACTIEDTCDTNGACASTPIPCCPIASDLSCGSVVEGTTLGAQAAPAVTDWSCLPTPYPAPERAHLFRAPCDGEVILHLEGQPGQLLFLIRGPPAHAQSPATQCLTGQCDTYTSAGLTQWMFTDQEYLLVVDGLEGSAGDYTLEVLCDCPQPAP